MNSISLCLNPAWDITVRTRELIPGRGNEVLGRNSTSGGKGINVAKAIKRSGGESLVMGFIGGKTGELIKNELSEKGIQASFIETQSETRTNIKIISGDGIYTEFNSKGGPVEKSETETLLNAMLKTMCIKDRESVENESVFVILSGSIPQGVENSVYKRIIEEARAEGCKSIKFIADCDKELLKNTVEARPFLIKPNIFEFSRLVDKEFSTSREASEECEKFYKETGINVLLTCGSEGSYLCSGEGVFRAECENIPGCNPNGAGDSVLGAFIARYAQTSSMGESLRYSSEYVREFLLDTAKNEYYSSRKA